MQKVYLILGFYMNFLILSLCYSLAYEFTLADQYEISIIERLIIDSVKKKNPYVYVYSENKNKKKFFYQKIKKFAKNIKLTSKLYKADFIIVLDVKKRKISQKPALALNFEAMKYCLSCVGVFSWKNGRPNLILFENKLEKFMIKLPKEYSYFIE